MFGMGITEMMLIAVVAVLFLGPDKLPGAMVEIAKFFRSVKGTVATAKETLESELDSTGIKQSIASHKEEFESASRELQSLTDISGTASDINDIKSSVKIENDNTTTTPPQPAQPEVVTFTKKPKSEENV
jgi:sec-independent protein translocase protein TatB